MRLVPKSTGVTLVLTCAALLASAAQAHQFGRPVFYPVADPPKALAAGDLNGDGRADLAVAEYQGGELQVLLGRGDGTFGSPITLTSGLSFNSPVTIADALGDGHNDVVVGTASASDEVMIFPGNGDGTFGSPVDVPVKFQPNAVAVGDFNGDGHPDLAVADGNDNVEVLLGQGGGRFGSPTVLPLGSNSTPNAITIAQLTHSGHLDIITANLGPTSNVSVLVGKGDGTFQPASTIPISVDPTDSQSLAVSDLNRDGLPDVVVIGGSSSLNGTAVQALIGQGDGTFTAKPAFAVNTGSSFTSSDSVPVADFTGDAIPDLAPDGVSLYPGLGDGTFGPPQAPFAGTIPYPIEALSADFNGDGKPDLAVGATDVNGNVKSADVAVLLNGADLQTGTPSLAPSPRRACYVLRKAQGGPGLGTLGFAGRHFYPGDSIQLATSLRAINGGSLGTPTGRVAPDGTIAVPWSATGLYPWLTQFHARTITFTATDQQDPTLAASTSVLVAPFSAFIQIPAGTPYIPITRKTTFHLLGFPVGSTLYEHYVHNGVRKTVRLGRAQGPCGAFKRALRWAAPGVPGRPRSEVAPVQRNLWLLWFDDHRTYSPRSSDRWGFAVFPFAP